MTFPEMVELVSVCTHPGYTFSVQQDGRGEIYLQGDYVEPDTVTGVPERQVTRRWFLSPAMTKSEIVQTVFKCLMTSFEHRGREWFAYKGYPVFGPHFDVDALAMLCRDGCFQQREP